MLIYTRVKWFYGQSECAYYLNHFIKIYNTVFYATMLSISVSSDQFLSFE